ncbi:MAG: zinc ribbon domain-containing protein [Pirellulales bacterium]
MPLYEYVCQKCQHEFEYLVRSADDQPVCPRCESQRLQRLLSVPAAHSGSSPSMTGPDPGTCGRPQCARGCQFGG